MTHPDVEAPLVARERERKADEGKRGERNSSFVRVATRLVLEYYIIWWQQALHVEDKRTTFLELEK